MEEKRQEGKRKTVKAVRAVNLNAKVQSVANLIHYQQKEAELKKLRDNILSKPESVVNGCHGNLQEVSRRSIMLIH